MRGYITSAAAAALVTMVASAATSLEWPVADPWLELSFGERWGETISRGVRLRSPLATVSAVSDGEAIFVRSGAGASLPASLGGLVVVAHAGGLLSVYAPLAPSFDPVVDGPAVEMGDQLGEVIAMTDEPLLHFSLHDAPRRAAVNPATLLPSLGSHPRPAIADVRVVRATTPSSAGAYHVEVVVGERAGGPPPYRAELLVDGRAERVITFDSLVTYERAIVALSDGETPAEAVVPSRRVLRFVNITLRNGERHLTVVLSNISGDSVVRDEVVAIGTTNIGATDKENPE